MLTTDMDKTRKLVRVETILPFRLRGEHEMRETKPGDQVDVEYWLAIQLANHHPPKVGPVTETGRRAAARPPQQAAA